MSKISDDTAPKRYRACAPRVMFRVPNSGVPAYGGPGPWMMSGRRHGEVLPPDVNPIDIEHLLNTTRPGVFGGRMIELIEDAPACAP